MGSGWSIWGFNALSQPWGGGGCWTRVTGAREGPNRETIEVGPRRAGDDSSYPEPGWEKEAKHRYTHTHTRCRSGKKRKEKRTRWGERS